MPFNKITGKQMWYIHTTEYSQKEKELLMYTWMDLQRMLLVKKVVSGCILYDSISITFWK